MTILKPALIYDIHTLFWFNLWCTHLGWSDMVHNATRLLMVATRPTLLLWFTSKHSLSAPPRMRSHHPLGRSSNIQLLEKRRIWELNHTRGRLSLANFARKDKQSDFIPDFQSHFHSCISSERSIIAIINWIKNYFVIITFCLFVNILLWY